MELVPTETEPVRYEHGQPMEDGVFLRVKHRWGVFAHLQNGGVGAKKWWYYFDVNFVGGGEPRVLQDTCMSRDDACPTKLHPFWLQRGEVFRLRGLRYTVERVFYRERVQENEAVVACYLTDHPTDKAEWGEKYLQVFAEIECVLHK